MAVLPHLKRQPDPIRRGEAAPVPFRLFMVLSYGVPLALLSAWIILRMEQPENYATPTGLTVYYPVIVLFGAGLFLNRVVLGRFAPRFAPIRSELLCIYSLMGLACAYACWENLGIIVPSLAFP